MIDIDKIRANLITSYIGSEVALSFLRNRTAFEFDTKEELKKYLDEHPGADRSLHWVKSPNKGKDGHHHPTLPKDQKKEAPKSLSLLEENKDVLQDVVRNFTGSVFDKTVDDMKDIVKEIKPEFFKTMRYFPVRQSLEQIYKEEGKDTEHPESFFRSFTGSGYPPGVRNCVWSEIVRGLFGQEGDDYRIGRTKELIKINPEKAQLYKSESDNKSLYEKQLKDYIAKEQAILIASGLVDKDGYVMIYRSSNHYNGEIGDDVDIQGNFVDSWTLDPRMYWGGRKVAARVPVSRVLASYLGKNEGPNYWPNIDEHEVIINSFDGLKGKIYGESAFTENEQNQLLNQIRESAKGVPFNDMPWPITGNKKEYYKVLPKTLGGSTGAKLVEDSNGKKWVFKDYSGNTAQIENEFIANKLYEAMGLPVPNTKLDKVDGQKGILSEFKAGYSPMGLSDLKENGKKFGNASSLIADALFANWDSVGLEGDNILVHKDSLTGKIDSVLKIDQGGALAFRAMGAPKGNAFGTEVKELQTLRDPNMNKNMATFYSHLSDLDIAKAIQENYSKMATAIGSISPGSIHFKEKHFSNMTDTDLNDLYKKLKERFYYMNNWANKIIEEHLNKQKAKPESPKKETPVSKPEPEPTPKPIEKPAPKPVEKPVKAPKKQDPVLPTVETPKPVNKPKKSLSPSSSLVNHHSILDYYELDGGQIETPLSKFKKALSPEDKKLSPGKTKMKFIAELDPLDFDSKSDYELAKKSLLIMSPIDFAKLLKAVK